jgi:hypothetical protein
MPKFKLRDILLAETAEGFHWIPVIIVCILIAACIAAALNKILIMLSYPF